MHLYGLSAPVLALIFGSIIFASPIAETQNLPRNHVQCNLANHLCQVQQTCDNAPSIVAGTVPDPWPSSVTPFANPIPSLQPVLNTGTAGGVATARKHRPRQPTTVRWCALGTEVYILLAMQGTQGAAAIQSTLATAIDQVETKLLGQTVKQSKQGVAAGTSPAYSLSGTNAKITVNNAQGVNLTWVNLELGLLMMDDWMGKNSYGWGSASIWDGTDQVGLIYITH